MVVLEIKVFWGVIFWQGSGSDVLKVGSTFVFRVKQHKNIVGSMGSLVSGKKRNCSVSYRVLTISRSS